VAARVRVLWLIKGMGPGGAERQLVEMARHVDTDRFDVQAAYLLPWKDHLVGELADVGVPSTCLRATRNLDPTWVSRLRALARGREIDIVHAHLPTAAVGARTAFRRRGPRVVSTEHNVWTRYRPITRMLNAVTFGWQAAAIAVSEEVARSIGPRVHPTVRVIPNGVDGERLRADALARSAARAELGLPEDAMVVGVVGGITPKKGHGTLVAAAPRVAASIPSVRFAFVGIESDGGAVRAEVHAMELEDRVRFLGYRSNASRLMRAFDLVCLPSLFEGMPVAMLEAMAIGVPVVATAVGGVPEVANGGRAAMIVPPRDPTALSDALAQVLSDEPLRMRLTEAAGWRVGDFDIERTTRATEDVYAELAARHR
jgi:glycosyltransferase involved in cell wall biosynthesis